MACTEIIGILWRWANFSSVSRRAIVPSSFIISMRAATGDRPANLAKSTEASVCPARCNTPCDLA